MITTEVHRTDALPLEAHGAHHQSGVSWAAIFAGAAAAAALSLILLMLGSGLGLSSMSPWSQQGMSATAVGVGAIVWITLMQIIASGMGGYLAGRLRTKWVSTHTDEVYFRDTAHGFLAWSVATLVTAAVLTSAIGGIVGSGVQAVAGAAGTAATAATAVGAGAAAGTSKGSSDEGGGMSYFVDSLFRKDPTTAAPGSTDAASAASSTSEVGRIFVQSLKNGSLAQDDANYVGALVAQRTGMSQQDATKRVQDTFTRLQANLNDAATKAKEAADAARKAASYASLWLFISLLIGAFSASLAATFGGRRRDL